jgi:hypothetical protein
MEDEFSQNACKWGCAGGHGFRTLSGAMRLHACKHSRADGVAVFHAVAFSGGRESGRQTGGDDLRVRSSHTAFVRRVAVRASGGKQ